MAFTAVLSIHDSHSNAQHCSCIPSGGYRCLQWCGYCVEAGDCACTLLSDFTLIRDHYFGYERTTFVICFSESNASFFYE